MHQLNKLYVLVAIQRKHNGIAFYKQNGDYINPKFASLSQNSYRTKESQYHRVRN